jgi:UDP-glucose 4-epimerase
LNRKDAAPAIWVDEEIPSAPKNIYGATKVMAENLCELTHRQYRLPVVVLRTSRFFPEEDDNPDVRRHYENANAQLNELLYRRVDIEDAVSAVMRALERAADIGFSRYIVSATSPFGRDDLAMFGRDAPRVVRRIFPECGALYAARGWKFFPQVDRVYVNDRARTELGWTPKYDFAFALECLRSDQDFRSPLSREVGSKGYHARSFADGPYPVA